MSVKTNNYEIDRGKLLKEVLGRAKKEEKQEHKAIIERQIAIAKRIKDIELEIEALMERNRNNEYPKRMDNTYHAPDKTHDEIMKMSSWEFHEWCQQIIREASEFNEEGKRWNDGFEIWNAKNTVILNEEFKLIAESISLKNEFYSLEDKEKWLLLSIALRSQPSLMKFIGE